jgi:N-methylhydantoinase B/oxoprolinase/acetone carboxylase alpha subunit
MGTSKQQNLRSKETNVQLKAGDTVTMLTSGGGGFGAAGVQV